MSTTPATIKPMQVMVHGRVEASRNHDGVRYTRILAPAPDAYSRPQTVEIRSKQPFGARGDEVKVLAQLGGYTRRPFETRDKFTGELLKVFPVDMTLDAVE